MGAVGSLPLQSWTGGRWLTVSLDLLVKNALREVVREEIRAALRDHPNGTEGLLDYRQAAAFIGCGVSTITAWARSGALPVLRRGRLCRVKREDLMRVMSETAEKIEETADDIAARIL